MTKHEGNTGSNLCGREIDLLWKFGNSHHRSSIHLARTATAKQASTYTKQ